jgi:hypothetical protein
MCTVHCLVCVMLCFVTRRSRKCSYDMIIVSVKPYIAINKKS